MAKMSAPSAVSRKSRSSNVMAALARTRYSLTDRPANIWSVRSEEHTSELQSLMRISYAVFCLKKKKNLKPPKNDTHNHYFMTRTTATFYLQTTNRTRHIQYVPTQLSQP